MPLFYILGRGWRGKAAPPIRMSLVDQASFFVVLHAHRVQRR